MKTKELQTENTQLRMEVADLKQQVAVLKKMVFGQKSEKTQYVMGTGDLDQLSLFDEAEQEENRKAREQEQPVVVTAHARKSKRRHEELLKDLPVEEVIHTVPEEQRVCNTCGNSTSIVGKEFVRDELVYVPEQLYVKKHFVEVLKCTKYCKGETEPQVQSFQKAQAPAPLIPHSFCSAQLLAHIAYEKYVMSVPLYRQEKDFAAKGVKLSRTTMANWLIYASKEWLAPIYEQMKKELCTHSVLHADETVVQVLNEPGKKPKTDSRMWVYCAGEIGCTHSIVFEYQPTRSGDHASTFLAGFTGHLVTDGYSGYEKVKNVTRCGCWAHVRRKFVEAVPQDKELAKSSNATKAVSMIDELFALERECETDPDRRRIRKEKSAPLIQKFYTWLGSLNPAGSAMSKAVGYAISQKKLLMAFLENPSVPISNNRAENAIRPFCVGRKNWLFSTSVKGAQASAMFYSIVASAKANDENVEQKLTSIFIGLQS